MKRIVPDFKDDTDKLIGVCVVILASLFFSFIPSLIVILFLKDYISESTYAIAKAMFNFQVFLFLIALFFIIPVLGWIAGVFLGPAIMIFNVIVIIINICAVTKGAETKIPVFFEFL